MDYYYVKCTDWVRGHKNDFVNTYIFRSLEDAKRCKKAVEQGGNRAKIIKIK